jgi:exodeoxyribonuclease VII large subunit
MNTLSVSSLNEQIKTLLEGTFNRVLVEGELSRITFHNSGHIYFTLKDSSSTLRAVMFRGNASKLKFQLKEGLKVVLDGAVTLYKPRGEYQINCFSIEPAGHGALALAYEQLKQKLSEQGYFNTELKKKLPRFPKKIALITSATGAALQDMLRVANARYRAIEVDIYDVLVQGQNASYEICNALVLADAKEYDVIVISRGGGSIEDLWAFNEERVADAIHYATTPIVSAIGHEIDWLISDFVADVRAATPSAAMQMVLPDNNELYQSLDSIASQFTQLLQQKVYAKTQALQHLRNSYLQHSVEKRLMQKLQEIAQVRESFQQSMEFKLQTFTRDVQQVRNSYPQAIHSIINSANVKLDNMKRMIESNHPKYKTKKGFAQISQNEKVIDISLLSEDDTFQAQSDTVVITAKVLKRKNLF